MNSNIVAIQFHDQSLTAALIDSVPHVAMKPICENLGLDWEAQRQRINRHPVLSAVACMIKAAGSDGKLYEMLMLPLEYLNGWLFGVDSNRVKKENKPKLIAYQKECFRVLANHFQSQPSGISGQLESPTITKSQQGELFTRAKHIAGESGKIGAASWLKQKSPEC